MIVRTSPAEVDVLREAGRVVAVAHAAMAAAATVGTTLHRALSPAGRTVH